MSSRNLVRLGFVLFAGTLFGACGGGDTTADDCSVKCDHVKSDCVDKCDNDDCKTKCSTDFSSCTASCDKVTTTTTTTTTK
jgi:hypothetical protein